MPVAVEEGLAARTMGVPCVTPTRSSVTRLAVLPMPIASGRIDDAKICAPSYPR